MTYTQLPVLADTGFVVLRRLDPPIPTEEYTSLEYVDWKSGGDTNFAPIASARGDLECAGFWEHGKPDKDGVWTVNAKLCPRIVEWVESVGANFGRVRTIKLEPQDYETALPRMHQDDNNRLNRDGEGWVVRAWLELTDNPDSFMVLRDDRDDPSTESRIPLPVGAQFIVDTERLYHVVSHTGSSPRYALIASFESGPALDRWIRSQLR
jgi:hypothetical protein